MDSSQTNNQLQDNRSLVIAIDGPAGVGKTTIGQMLAAWLGLNYLDTGAMYRAVTWQALRHSVALTPPDEAALAELGRALDFVSCDATAEEAADGRQYTVRVAGQDVSQQLRSPEVEKWVSVVAAVARLRTELVERQREMARHSAGIIMIGRDIGSVVLPDADLKIYLDASPEVRANRRSRQEAAKTTEEARRALEKRDRIDSQRATAPMVIPSGALVISTDHLSPQQVVERIEVALAPLLSEASQGS